MLINVIKNITSLIKAITGLIVAYYAFNQNLISCSPAKSAERIDRPTNSTTWGGNTSGPRERLPEEPGTTEPAAETTPLCCLDDTLAVPVTEPPVSEAPAEDKPNIINLTATPDFSSNTQRKTKVVKVYFQIENYSEGYTYEVDLTVNGERLPARVIQPDEVNNDGKVEVDIIVKKAFKWKKRSNANIYARVNVIRKTEVYAFTW